VTRRRIFAPSVLFLTLEGPSARAGVLAAFDAPLRARIASDAATTGGRLAGWIERIQVPCAWLTSRSAAMLLVVAGTLLLSRPGASDRAEPAAGASGIPSPYERPFVRALPARRRRAPRLPAWRRRPPGAPRAGPDCRRWRRSGPLRRGSTASDGAGDDATPIYFVVDEAIDF